MDRLSVFKFLQLPDAFGVTILTVAFVALLIPYLPSGDFGPLKIPALDEASKRKLRIWGPIATIFSIFSFFPLIPNSDAVRLTNPFGAQEILLDGSALLVTSAELTHTAAKKPETILSYPKYGFYIDKPAPNSGFNFELITPKAYNEVLSEKVIDPENKIGGDFLAKAKAGLLSDPLFASGEVFRIYREGAISLKSNSNSRTGPLASPEKLAEAKKEQREAFERQFSALKGASSVNGETTSKPDSTNPATLSPGTLADKMQSAITSGFANVRGQRNEFNELSIVIIDRQKFELKLTADKSGRNLPATPLTFMFKVGGSLPYFDIYSVKEGSISTDNKVWGFYGRTQWINVKVNGVLQQNVFYDFYRIYVINSSYLYQITLSYIPVVDQPRSTWDDLVKLLRSLRISSE